MSSVARMKRLVMTANPPFTDTLPSGKTETGMSGTRALASIE
jgi:hypothetical protein